MNIFSLFQAIFGGHIGGKKTNGVKTNPVFKDGKIVRKGNNSDIENDMGGIEIQVYNSIPKSSLNSTTKHENIKMKEELTKENSRDKVTVTNGDICIGDIIIENGYRNPAFTLDTDSIHEENDVLEHTVKYTGEGEGRENLAGTEWPDLDNIALPSVPENQNEIKTTNTHDDEAYILIDYNRNNKKTKNEIDSSDIQIDIISENVGGDEVLKVQTIASIKETENSEKVPSDIEKDEIDTQNVNKSENENQLEEKTENDLSAFQISDEERMNLNSPSSENSEENITKDVEKEDTQQTNGTIHQKTNGTLHTEPNLNGSVNSNFCVDEFIQQNDIVNESKDKSKKKTKKIKERKNSLPDHILNSLNKKPSKPILVPVVMDNSVLPVGRSRSTDNSNEHKSVKFSDDTVFNDLKPNKYKQERVSLKDIYKGKISSKEAVAKMNPVFVDEDNHGLTDDEKVEKCRQVLTIIWFCYVNYNKMSVGTVRRCH